MISLNKERLCRRLQPDDLLHLYAGFTLQTTYKDCTCHFSMPNLCMGSSLYVSVSSAISGFSLYSAHPSVKAV